MKTFLYIFLPITYLWCFQLCLRQLYLSVHDPCFSATLHWNLNMSLKVMINGAFFHTKEHYFDFLGCFQLILHITSLTGNMYFLPY